MRQEIIKRRNAHARKKDKLINDMSCHGKNDFAEKSKILAEYRSEK